MAKSLSPYDKSYPPETDLAKAIQSSVLEKRFSDVETRLRDEQKTAEARHETVHERIEARFDRLEAKVDSNHRWTIGFLITILLAIFGVLFTVVAPYITLPF